MARAERLQHFWAKRNVHRYPPSHNLRKILQVFVRRHNLGTIPRKHHRRRHAHQHHCAKKSQSVFLPHIHAAALFFSANFVSECKSTSATSVAANTTIPE